MLDRDTYWRENYKVEKGNIFKITLKEMSKQASHVDIWQKVFKVEGLVSKKS